MKMLPGFVCVVTSLLGSLSASPAQNIKEEAVEYKSGDTICEGWHIYDADSKDKKPSVLIVHQWTGISDNEKDRGRMLAGMGYNVLLADIYGKVVRPKPPESGKEAGKYKGDTDLFRERLKSGLDTLLADERTDPKKVVAIGYCFGGMGVLELARSGADICGVVSFHGNLATPHADDAKNIKCPVLVCHGTDDPYVSPKEVEGFQEAMTAAGVKYEFVAYPGAVHSFTQKSAGNDKSKGSAYNAEADAKSWIAMKRFFAEVLK